MKTFICKYKKSIVAAIAFSFLCFGFMLTHFSLTIDEESWILASKNLTMWLYQGRYSIWLLELLFTHGGDYAPFLWDFLGILFWNFSGVIFSYVLFEKKEVDEKLLFVMLAYYGSIPLVLADVLSFTMYSVWIGLAVIAVAVAFLLTIRYIENADKKKLFFSYLLLVYAFGTYQAFICVYVTAIVAACALIFLDVSPEASEDMKESRKNLVRTIITGALECIAAVISYWLINFLVGVLIGKEAYLENYIGWKDANPLKQFVLSLANVPRTSLGIGVPGAVSVCVVTVLFAIFAIYRFFKVKGLKEKLGVFFFTVALCAAPYSLYIAMVSHNTQGRMLLGIPLVVSVQVYFLWKECSKLWMRRVLAVIMIWTLFINARDMNQYFYYSSIIYDKDCDVAAQIMYDVQKLGADYRTKPIAFIGMLEKDDLDIKELGVLGGSFFSWDGGNNSRITDFLETRGYAVQRPTAEQLREALEKSETMTTWPQEGSVVELDDVIVVNLSKPTETWHTTNGI